MDFAFAQPGQAKAFPDANPNVDAGANDVRLAGDVTPIKPGESAYAMLSRMVLTPGGDDSRIHTIGRSTGEASRVRKPATNQN